MCLKYLQQRKKILKKKTCQLAACSWTLLLTEDLLTFNTQIELTTKFTTIDIYSGRSWENAFILRQVAGFVLQKVKCKILLGLYRFVHKIKQPKNIWMVFWFMAAYKGIALLPLEAIVFSAFMGKMAKEQK